jgi:hypothetical protein
MDFELAGKASLPINKRPLNEKNWEGPFLFILPLFPCFTPDGKGDAK